MLTLDGALKVIASVVPPLRDTERCATENALDRVLAEDVVAPCALPPFTNTGVDGYAFRHAENFMDYKIVGASYAGESYAGVVGDGEAVRIATGAVLPDGADTVVMQEVCAVEGGRLQIAELPGKGSNLRLAGGDIAQGQTAVARGQRLRPQDIAFLSALGVQDVVVTRKIRVAVASSGLELRGSGETPGAGQIVDTNRLMLAQMLTRAGAEMTPLSPMPDEYAATWDALKNAAAHHDIVITTGGVSVGDRDFIRDVLHDEGAVHFWKLAIRPGKPVIFGSIGSCIMLGLPGNPVSAYVTCLLIVHSVFAALRGTVPTLPDGYAVRLASRITKPEQLRAFPRARYRNGEVFPYDDQSSNLYSSLTKADGLLDLPEGRRAFESGEIVTFRPFAAWS